MEYSCDSRDYLLRARERLDENKAHTLFYAALELRFGIEARLKKYSEVIDDLSKKKKKGWRIVELSKNIESIFREGNKLIKLEFCDSYGKPLGDLIYTPVSKKLIKDGGKIGALLHSNNHFKTKKNNWYINTKKFLEDAYCELEFANKGTLLGPPLYHPSGRFDLAIEFYDGYDAGEIYKMSGGKGSKITMNLSYPEKL